MIRVLHYIPGFLYGGIESMFLSWYRNIDHSKIQFDLLLRTQDDEAASLVEYRRIGGVYYRLAPLSLKEIGKFKKSVDNFFKDHHDYDILHAHEADPFVMSSAKRHGVKKIIIHSHTTSCGNGLKERIRYYDEKLSMKLYADYAFACSELAANWKFGGLKFKNTDVTIVHNAVIADRYDYNMPARKGIRDNLELGNKFAIVHIGRMSYPKNQFFLLDIFAECLKKDENVVLIMIGDGPDKAALEEYAISKNIIEKILFLGVRNDVDCLLQGMDCFLLPSRYEGLPVTLIEAQAAGLPCVISDVITKEADITDVVHRLSIEESPECWAHQIEEIRNSFVRKSTKDKIVQNGFDVKNEVISLMEKYQEITEEDII